MAATGNGALRKMHKFLLVFLYTAAQMCQNCYNPYVACSNWHILR